MDGKPPRKKHRTQSSAATILSLPAETLFAVFDRLPPLARASCRLVCWTFHSVARMPRYAIGDKRLRSGKVESLFNKEVLCRMAAEEGRLGMLEWLRELGCYVFGISILKAAAERDHMQIVKWWFSMQPRATLWSDHVDRILYTRSMKLLGLPKDPEQRAALLEKCLAEPNIVSMDLSACGVVNEDMEAIARGLALRSTRWWRENDADPLLLLDLSRNDGLKKRGVNAFLGHCQDGFKRCDLKMNPSDKPQVFKVFPVVRNLLVKVPDAICLKEERLEEWFSRAPNVFLDGVRILNGCDS